MKPHPSARWMPADRARLLARRRAGETLDALAREFGVSRERIRQVTVRALRDEHERGDTPPRDRLR